MELAEAVDLISHAIRSGTAANAYLVCGDVTGNCRDLADAVLASLFPEDAQKIAAHVHPDVAWLEPAGKSRTIKTDDMLERIVRPMSLTSYSGGWKVGVIVGVDRLQPEAANRFLKTLEEPPPKTLFLLLTDQPDVILPTIVSRTQRVSLPMPAGVLDGEFGERIRELMTAPCTNAVCEKAAIGAKLAAVLVEAKDSVDGEEVPIVRKRFFRTILSFVRTWMVEGRLPRHQAFRNVEFVEDAFRQSDRAMPDEMVLCYLTERLVFPKVTEAAS